MNENDLRRRLRETLPKGEAPGHDLSGVLRRAGRLRTRRRLSTGLLAAFLAAGLILPLVFLAPIGGPKRLPTGKTATPTPSPTGHAVASVSFEPAAGWVTRSYVPLGPAVHLAAAWASTVPFSRRDVGTCPGLTAHELPPDGIAICATLPGPDVIAGRYPPRDLPLRLSDGRAGPWEGQPSPTELIITAWLKGEPRASWRDRWIAVNVYLGSRHPSPSQLARAQAELDRLQFHPASPPPSVRGLRGVSLSGEIAYKCGNDLCLVRPDGRGQHALTLTTPFPIWDPAWSPDGRRIAVRGYWGLGDGQYSLYALRLAPCAATRLTRDIAADPTWSPDGTRIAFDRGAILTVPASGGETTRLTSGRYRGDQDSQPTWSAQGEVAFVRYPPGHYGGTNWGSLYAVGETGTGLRRILAARGLAQPAWSPDGSRLAFVAFGPHESGIEVANADGTGVRPLPTPGGWNWNPVWTPDGRHIAFLHATGPSTSGPGRIYIEQAEGSPPTLLLPNVYADQFAWSGLATGRITGAC